MRSYPGYRLPTLAQREWAAWGGVTPPRAGDFWHFGSDSSPWDLLKEYAWFGATTGGNSGSTTHPVGTKTANQYGLYDMGGNVFEWCWDRWGSYVAAPGNDYSGPESDSFRTNRGGGWRNPYMHTRPSDHSSGSAPSNSTDEVGFRVVRP